MNNNGAIYKNDRRANVNGCSRKGEESKGVEPQPQRGGGGKRRRRTTTTRWALQGFLATVYTNALNQLIILWGSFGILWDSLGFFRIPGGLLRIPRDSWFIRRIYLGIIRGYFGIIWVSWLIARIFEGFYGIVKGSLVHCKDSKGFSVILKDSFGISSGFSVLFLRVLEGSRRISISFQAARWIFQDFLEILSPFQGSGGILSLISGNFEGFFLLLFLCWSTSLGSKSGTEIHQIQWDRQLLSIGPFSGILWDSWDVYMDHGPTRKSSIHGDLPSILRDSFMFSCFPKIQSVSVRFGSQRILQDPSMIP